MWGSTTFRDLRFQSTTSIEDGFVNECAHFLNEVGSQSSQSRRLACLIQRIAAIRKLQLYNALNPRIDPVSRPPCPLDRREFRYVRTVWPPKPATVRLSRH